MESQHIHIAGGLGELLTWDLKRGKPFQNLMVMVYYCQNYPEERLNTSGQLEKWLHRTTEPSAAFKGDIVKVLRDMWKIASDDNLNDAFTSIGNILSPVEFVFIGTASSIQSLPGADLMQVYSYMPSEIAPLVPNPTQSRHSDSLSGLITKR